MYSRFTASHNLAVENKFTSDCDFLHSFFISVIASVVGSSLDKGCGQQSLGNESQLGPFHLWSLSSNSPSWRPLVGRSDGLSFPAIWFHELVSVFFLIPATRFSTNCLNSLSTPLVQNNAVIESVQQYTDLIIIHELTALSTAEANLWRNQCPQKFQPG